MGAPKIELHRTRDFGKKLNATIEFIKENFKPLFKSLFYISGPFILIGTLLFSQVYSGFIRRSLNQVNNGFNMEDELFNIISVGLAAAVFLFIGGTMLIATVNEYILIYEKKGNEISVEEVWAKVKEKFFSVLGTMIALFVFIVFTYAITVFIIIFTADASIALTVILSIICFFFLIYAYIAFSLVFIVRAYEQIGIVESFQRCLFLVKGKWWSTFGLIFVASLIQSICSWIFFVPWYGLMIYDSLHNLNEGFVPDRPLYYQILQTLLLTLYMMSSYILYCIPLVAIAFQYFNLVELKEARGLMSKIETLGGDEQKEDDEEHY